MKKISYFVWETCSYQDTPSVRLRDIVRQFKKALKDSVCFHEEFHFVLLRVSDLILFFLFCLFSGKFFVFVFVKIMAKGFYSTEKFEE